MYSYLIFVILCRPWVYSDIFPVPVPALHRPKWTVLHGFIHSLDWTTGILDWTTVFPRSAASAIINFPLLALAATIRGRCLLEGSVNYTLHDSLLFSSIIFDYVMFKSGSDYCLRCVYCTGTGIELQLPEVPATVL